MKLNKYLTQYKLSLFALLLVSFFSCDEEKKKSINILENQFLMESKYAATDEALKNYIPAKKDEIELVRTAEDNYVIEYGYQFGECIGFCKSKIIFTSEGILETRTRWSDSKEIIEYYSIEDSIYNNLITSINYEDFLAFDENLGCGDCADAGAEWIEIKKGEQEKNIWGTFGFDLESVTLLLQYLRNLKK